MVWLEEANGSKKICENVEKIGWLPKYGIREEETLRARDENNR